MIEPLQLSVAQQFDIERLGRAIDSTTHVPDLQALCKQLLQAWQTQKAACAWVMAQGLQPRWSSPEEVEHLMTRHERQATELPL